MSFQPNCNLDDDYIWLGEYRVEAVYGKYGLSSRREKMVEVQISDPTAFESKRDEDYPPISQGWRRNWPRIIPFFEYPPRNSQGPMLLTQ